MQKTIKNQINKNNKGVYYVWFHHCVVPYEMRHLINDVINNHDYEFFMALYTIIKDMEPDSECEFLPSVGYVEDEDGLKEVDITKKKNFFRIRVCDCECG